MTTSVTLGDTDLAPTPVDVAHTRETWEKQWENSRLTRVNEHMGEARSVAMDLILEGQVEAAAGVWGTLAPTWALMLATPAEQSEAIRAAGL